MKYAISNTGKIYMDIDNISRIEIELGGHKEINNGAIFEIEGELFEVTNVKQEGNNTVIETYTIDPIKIVDLTNSNR